MKKFLASLILLTGLASVAFAIPARPGARPARQPDGSVIMLTLHGDEYCHWVTNQAGTIVEKGADGFWRPSGKTIGQHNTQLAPGAVRPRAAWSSYDNPPETNFGDRKILAILVNFTDSTFVLDNPKTRFHNLLNQEGYSDGGGHGSVRDYYMENSGGQYRPSFDVYGPVALTHSSAYYDGTTSVAAALNEACAMLDSEIDFSNYDTDGNGTVDMILLYYAGHNEAEGAGTESIWPHQSTGYGTFDGVKIGKYFCTSELSGESGANMCGIGTTTHEFAHSLGLPDFYDTDYENNGGYNGTTNWYDVMSIGPYLESGTCPPYFNAIERNMLGWMPAPDVLSESGAYSLGPVQDNAAYRVNTENEGEFFILEARNGLGWDYGLPDNGLAVYHVDQSQNNVSGYTAQYLWNNTNKINAYYGHPCFYIQTTSGGLPESSQWRDMLFGGISPASGISLKRWSGDYVGMTLSGITLSGGTVSFHAFVSGGRSLSGVVSDSSGGPIGGVQVTLSQSAYPFAGAPTILPTDLVAVTDSDGSFCFDIREDAGDDQIVTFRKDGYVTFAQNLTLTDYNQLFNVTLFGRDEAPEAELTKVDESGTLTRGGLGEGSRAVAMRYTADEISALGYAGAKITAIYMVVSECTYTDAYLMVYFGDEQVFLEKPGSLSFDSISGYDISSFGLTIPDGKDVYIGYGLTGLVSGEYPFYMRTNGGTSPGGNFAMANFETGGTDWRTPWQQYDYLIYADLELPVPEATPASFDVAYIKVQDGAPVAVPSSGKTLKDTTWYLDGTQVATPPALSTLGSGAHTYKAVLRHYDGTSETIWFDVER